MANGVRRRDVEGGGAALLSAVHSCTAPPPLMSVYLLVRLGMGGRLRKG